MKRVLRTSDTLNVLAAMIKDEKVQVEAWRVGLTASWGSIERQERSCVSCIFFTVRCMSRLRYHHDHRYGRSQRPSLPSLSAFAIITMSGV